MPGAPPVVTPENHLHAWALHLQIFVTVIFNGGTTGWLLKKLKLTEAERLDSKQEGVSQCL